MSKQNIANEELIALLSRASEGERLELSKILKPNRSYPMSPNELAKEIGLTGGHGIANFLRGGNGIGYLEILNDAVSELGLATPEEILGKFEGKYRRQSLEEINHPPTDTKTREFFEARGLRIEPFTQHEIKELREAGNRYAENFELRLIQHVLKAAYNNLKPEEKHFFDQELARVASSLKADKDPSALAGAAGLMTVANLGGFATYTLMSSLLSTISLGTLGFGAYTAASSLLSIVIGPVGWLALGTVAAYKFGKPELERTVPFAATVGMIRQRLRAGIPPQENKTKCPPEIPTVADPDEIPATALVAEPLKLLSETTVNTPKVEQIVPFEELPEINKKAYSVEELLHLAGRFGDSKSQEIEELLADALLPAADDFEKAANRKYMFRYRWPKAHEKIFRMLPGNTLADRANRKKLQEAPLLFSEQPAPPQVAPLADDGDPRMIVGASSFVRFFERRSDLLYHQANVEIELTKAQALPSVEELEALLTEQFGPRSKWESRYNRIAFLLLNQLRRDLS